MTSQLHARWEFETGQDRWSAGSGTTRDLDVLRAIDELIRNRRLTTHFQPIYTTIDGSVFGFESLARQIAPASFSDPGALFRAANISGCLNALDKLCLETALGCLAESQILDHDWHLFINICPETFMNPAFPCRIFTDLVRGAGISCERVILEITEESVITNYALFRSSLDSYRQQGFRIAIDDFGVGYAGLKMLSTVEPDFVKIDRHFIADINRSYINAKLVEAVATACGRIGIKVVAEGIEHREELVVVSDMGIDLVQGFLLGRPAPYLNGLPAAGVSI